MRRVVIKVSMTEVEVLKRKWCQWKVFSGFKGKVLAFQMRSVVTKMSTTELRCRQDRCGVKVGAFRL